MKSRPRRDDPMRTTHVEVADEDWLVGKTLEGRYRVERVLGEGGMGRVYECSDTAFHRRLVLKTLLPGLSDDKTAWPRFLREARAAADLGSPHIVAVQEFGNLDDGRSYYLMELADGVSLDAVLDGAKGPLPTERALRIARGIARALEAAHAAKIVHRDLKPDNVLLVVQNGQPDFVKIVDFGLALMMNAAVRITGRGEMVGSPYYMSPEQCADEAIDGRADIYALGVILFEMLTLDLPHDHENMVEVLKAKLLHDAPRATERGAQISDELDTLIARCLERRPIDRFADAAALGAALDAVLGDAPPPRAGFTQAASTPAPPRPAAAAPGSAPPAPAVSERPSAPQAAPTPAGSGPSPALIAVVFVVIFVASGAIAALAAHLLS